MLPVGTAGVCKIGRGGKGSWGWECWLSLSGLHLKVLIKVMRFCWFLAFGICVQARAEARASGWVCWCACVCVGVICWLVCVCVSVWVSQCVASKCPQKVLKMLAKCSCVSAGVAAATAVAPSTQLPLNFSSSDDADAGSGADAGTLPHS